MCNKLQVQKFIIYKNNVHTSSQIFDNALEIRYRNKNAEIRKKYNSKKNQRRKFPSIRPHEMLRDINEDRSSDFITNSCERTLTMYNAFRYMRFFYKLRIFETKRR